MPESTGKVEMIYTSKKSGEPLLTGDGRPFWNIMIGGTRYSVFDEKLFPLIAKGNWLRFEFSTSKDGQFHNILRAEKTDPPTQAPTAPASQSQTNGQTWQGRDAATQESIVRQSSLKAAAEIIAMAGMPWPEEGKGYVERTVAYTLEIADRFLAWAMEPYRRQEREKAVEQVKALWKRAAAIGLKPPEPPKADATTGDLLKWCEATEPVIRAAEEDAKKKAAEAPEGPWNDQ